MKNSKSVVFRRQQELLNILQRQRKIDVDTVSGQLHVSATTIRRDLMMFEKQHLVRRFHGGAKLLEGALKEEDPSPMTMVKSGVDREQKEAIARYAADLIEDGDTIFMNSCSTALKVVDYLQNKHVVIVTNNSAMIGYPHDPMVTVILTGGELYQKRQTLIGEFAMNTLTKINADKAFLGVGGISVKGGITTSVLPETAINDLMLRRCRGTCYILAANSKIGRDHNFLSASVDSIDTLITCQGGNPAELQNLRDRQVEVIELDCSTRPEPDKEA